MSQHNLSSPSACATKPRLKWENIILFPLLHFIALGALFFRPKVTDVLLFLVFYFATGFGVTVGFHRLLAHRSFECSRLTKWCLAFLGTAALQGSPIWWVRIHRAHHQASDQAGDPHSPHESFFHGHIGWMLRRLSLIGKGDLTKDVTADRFLLWLDQGVTPFVPWLLTAAICFLVGGWSGFIWGAALRTVCFWHATWCVNSVCHRYGSRPRKTADQSGNVWWVGLCALGEGWHNNHHAFSSSALHGFRFREIDLSGYLILLMELIGLAWKIKKPVTSIAAGSITNQLKS